MSSDLEFPTSSPTTVNALKTTIPKRYQSYEAEETDDELSPNGKDKDPPRILPPALWAPSGNNNMGVIRIPPQPLHTPVKRKLHNRSPVRSVRSELSISLSPELPAKITKKWRPKDFEQDPSSELEVLVQKSNGKLKHRPRSSKISPADPIHTSPKHRRRRGRPHKDRKVSVEQQSSSDFSAHVYVEIANPPKLHRGKTHKTDKYVSQDPTTEGPFTFTHDMNWMSFLSQVAQLAELEEDNVVLTQMTWHFQGKAKSLPLGNIGGFMAMVMQVRALRVGASAIIMIGLPVPPPKPSRGGRNAPAATEDVTDSGAASGEVMWGEKLSLDDQLTPIIEKLHSMHKIGTCAEHPTIRCFRWVANNWHFNIDRTRTKVWANAILRKMTDYDQVPLASNHFKAADRLESAKPVALPAPVSASPNMSAAPSHLWDGHLYGPSGPGPTFQSPHYSHSYRPMALYSNYYNPTTPFPPALPPTAHADQAQLASSQTNHMATLSAPQAAVKKFCDKYEFGDEEREGLRKLGFRIGDDLGTITEGEWVTCGLAPLHRRRVLLAWNTERTEHAEQSLA